MENKTEFDFAVRYLKFLIETKENLKRNLSSVYNQIEKCKLDKQKYCSHKIVRITGKAAWRGNGNYFLVAHCKKCDTLVDEYHNEKEFLALIRKAKKLTGKKDLIKEETK